MGVIWRPLIMFTRGVLVTLPALKPMLPKNPKGLNGSIKSVQPTGGSRFRLRVFDGHWRLPPVADTLRYVKERPYVL